MTETLDRAALDGLLDMVGGDAEFVDELVDTFLADAARQVAEIRSAIAAARPGDVVRPAHTLKGSSASIGAREVEAISRAIEEQSRAGLNETLADHLAALERALDTLAGPLADARARRWVGH